MASLWHLVLLCWAWSPLCLSSSVSFIGTPQECEKAHFVPGYNLGGEGFDIVTMERKGAYVIDTETWKLQDGTCKMYRNSYMNQVKQKVPVSVLDWRILPKCSLSVSSTLYDSAETLANDSTSSVSNDWKVGLDIPVSGSVGFGIGFGGSHSKASTFAMQKSKQDRYSFFRHSVKCNFYTYRLKANAPLSHDFESAVKSLPYYSDATKHLYRNLVETYGTHYITQVYLGGEMKAITSIKTCEAAMNGLSATDVNDCLTVEASVSFMQSASIKTMNKYCEAMKSKLKYGQGFSGTFSERYTEVIGGHINGADILFQGQSPNVVNHWVNSLKSIPDVVRYNIKPMHMLLLSSHYARAGLKLEVEKYIKKNALMKKCSETCKVGYRSSRRDPCACVCNSNQNIKSNCCPAGKGRATLKVFKLYAKNLYGDRYTQTDGSVELKYGYQSMRTAIIPNNDNPEWSEVFEFEPITINMRDKLVLDVYDEDSYWNSDHLGQCQVKPRKGWRNYTCMLNHGTLFFSCKVECAPSLGGDYCDEYIPSPMSPSLAKVFHTRNGILIGETGEQHGKSVRPGVEVKQRETL